MKIVFDCTSCQPAPGIETNGGGEYSLRLLDKLFRMNSSLEIIVLLSKSKGKNRRIEEFGFKYYFYSNMKELSSYLSEIEADVIIFPVAYPWYGELKILKDTPIICGIHDLSEFYEIIILDYKRKYFNDDGLDWARALYTWLNRKAKYKKLKNLHEKIFQLNNNTHVYTVSYYSKHAMEYYLDGCSPENVFYSPNKILKDNEIECKKNDVLTKFSVKEGFYFLLSNACRWLKNNERALLAFDNLFRRELISQDIFILVLGCNDKFIRHMKRKLICPKNFIFKGFVADVELECLYKYAKAYVYPSLLEGFGYPPIEAMKYGTVSLCSTSTSIPEITGGNAIYFSPYSIEEIELAILHSFDQNYMVRFESEKIINYYNHLRDIQDRDLNRLINFILNVGISE